MMRHTVLTLLIGALLLPVAACPPRTPSTVYQPFPSGYGYMQENEALIEAVKKGDHTVVRQHGWKLWAGIMQPAQNLDWPIWYTWPNTRAAFAPEKTKGTGLADVQVDAASKSLLKLNADRLIQDNVPLPIYPIPEPVLKKYPKAISRSFGTQCKTQATSITIRDGAHVLFNGDIMIPTESLSMEAMDWIRNPKKPLYLQATLNKLHKEKVHILSAPQRHIVTKHMYWPVKAAGLSAIPVWRNDYGPDYVCYAGYETWSNLIAVDPSGNQVGKTAQVSYLYGVLQADYSPYPTVTAQARVYGLEDFYHHKVTQADWDSFDEADKAIINASSYWAYNEPFGPGDYLVTVAMHINTKEIPTWTMQSVWWSDQYDAGKYAADRPALPQAQGPWWHYLLVDAYGIPETLGGTQPVAMNPYIELAIHPVATNCNTCHRRAGWPTGNKAGFASYQNPDCPNLLETLTPNSACLKPLTLTDFQWIIPDRALPTFGEDTPMVNENSNNVGSSQEEEKKSEGLFSIYLMAAYKKVIEKYPDAKFYSGEYRPDIMNLHYEYIFANASTGIKVTVNTTYLKKKVNYLIHNTVMPKGLKPIDLPIKLALMDAYHIAVKKGMKPNLKAAIVFLQDDLDRKSNPNPQYWFLDQNDNKKWILVDVNPPHAVKVTTAKPIDPQ